jgi:hypothetical protein
MQERLEEKFFVPYFSAKPFNCVCKPFLKSQTNVLYLKYRVHSVFYEFMVNSNIVVSFNHKVVMKRCLEDDGIEKQLK